MVDLKMFPQEIFMFQTLKRINVTIFRKRYFADMIKLRIWIWEGYPRWARWTLNDILNVLKREAEGCYTLRKEKGNVTPEAENGEVETQPRNAGSHQKLKEERNRLSPNTCRLSIILWTPWLQPSDTDVGLVAFRTVREHISIILR